MKKNTQMVLLSLYYDVNSSTIHRVPVERLQWLTPELTDGGFRSLLHVLRKQKLITVQKALGVSRASITHYGAKQLEAEFPALNSRWDSWDGSWDCMVFLSAPSFDKQFRYLRNLVVSEKAFPLSRGVYLAAHSFSQRVVSECVESYFGNVTIFSVGSWKVATEAEIIISHYGLQDVAEASSGISKEVSSLIEAVDTKKRLLEKQKESIYLVYDRVNEILLEDPGFCTFYFSDAPSLKNTLYTLNHFLSIG